MSTHPYIAIEGVIGVGKTTLARYLQQALDAALLLEVFEENPFLSDFYADRSRYAFQTQIFFLLSRYRQQHRVISQTIMHQPLVSDYLFDKDWLFAHLNLANDELTIYEHTYLALAERIPTPQLVVHLRASVDTLMERIALRDRPYERNMSRDYIADLYQTYDDFFDSYTEAPFIAINTDELDIVHNFETRQAVIGQIKSALTQGVSQPPLPYWQTEAPQPPSPLLAESSRRLPDFQKFHRTLDKVKGFSTDLYFNYILLTEEIGELGSEIAHLWRTQKALQGSSDAEAQTWQAVLSKHHPQLQAELADCLAYLLKLANYAGIDLETAYLEKMNKNINRVWSKWSEFTNTNENPEDERDKT